MNNDPNYLVKNRKADNIFKFGSEWFFRTPERALEKAYSAAVKIKLIEDEYFQGKKISECDSSYSQTIIDCFIVDLNKYLNLVKINLAEFKVSRFLLNKTNIAPLEKLVFIDEIIDRYTPEKIDYWSNWQQPQLTLDNSGNFNASINRERNTLSTMNVDPVDSKSGALPRSIGRTIQKIRGDLDNNTEEQVVQNFRRSRLTTKLATRTFLFLIVIPLLTQQLSKQFVFLPLIEQNRDTEKAAIFINPEMEEEAFNELRIFEERLNFESLIGRAPKLATEQKEEKLKEKAAELAVEFKEKSNIALSNVFADLLSLVAFAFVAFTNQQGIAAIKNLLDTIVYDLSDSAKAFIIILSTDIFVGFHSPHGWEVLLESVAIHLGLEANKSAISLFIATFPVILDTIFKYWIFRYLNRISPSAVATLKEMNE
jgi:CemA family